MVTLLKGIAETELNWEMISALGTFSATVVALVIALSGWYGSRRQRKAQSNLMWMLASPHFHQCANELERFKNFWWEEDLPLDKKNIHRINAESLLRTISEMQVLAVGSDGKMARRMTALIALSRYIAIKVIQLCERAGNEKIYELLELTTDIKARTESAHWLANEMHVKSEKMIASTFWFSDFQLEGDNYIRMHSLDLGHYNSYAKERKKKPWGS